MTNHLSRAHDPPTSSEAIANHEASGTLTNNRQKVLRGVKCYPRLTACELAEIIGMDFIEVRRRVSDLKRLGKIKYVERRTCGVKGNKMMTSEAV